MEAVIYGCGQLTTLLAPHLVQDGYRVTVLDNNADRLALLSGQTSVKTILASEPLMQDYLQEANIDTSEVFLALSNEDHQNVLMAQIAHHLFNIPTVVCRLDNPQLQQIYTELGLKVVGMSAALLAQDIRQAIQR